ncbi:hypothetical protein AVEN_107388-1 [Araneus ventricosus]|uniref:Uncharacterized protein n=1 Tax=Araneus ventricosus TaxID=182803 RepID=A0A4Y2IZN7_ARAVE|nr:hypothetical protein AVEN_107388-1 [Araneus ventricosus]
MIGVLQRLFQSRCEIDEVGGLFARNWKGTVVLEEDQLAGSESARVYVDSQPVPHNPLELSFDTIVYQGYYSLFSGNDKLVKTKDCSFKRRIYQGDTLFGTPIYPDLYLGDHLNLIKHSNLRLELRIYTHSYSNHLCADLR